MKATAICCRRPGGWQTSCQQNPAPKPNRCWPIPGSIFAGQSVDTTCNKYVDEYLPSRPVRRWSGDTHILRRDVARTKHQSVGESLVAAHSVDSRGDACSANPNRPAHLEGDACSDRFNLMVRLFSIYILIHVLNSKLFKTKNIQIQNCSKPKMFKFEIVQNQNCSKPKMFKTENVQN
jgi:hypothetical protein